jgi:hypothetical protein
MNRLSKTLTHRSVDKCRLCLKHHLSFKFFLFSLFFRFCWSLPFIQQENLTTNFAGHFLLEQNLLPKNGFQTSPLTPWTGRKIANFSIDYLQPTPCQTKLFFYLIWEYEKKSLQKIILYIWRISKHLFDILLLLQRSYWKLAKTVLVQYVRTYVQSHRLLSST